MVWWEEGRGCCGPVVLDDPAPSGLQLGVKAESAMKRDAKSLLLPCILEDLIEDNILWGGGPLPDPEGARRDMYRTSTLGGEYHFQVFKVSHGFYLTVCL